MKLLFTFVITAGLVSCTGQPAAVSAHTVLSRPEGHTVNTRFAAPEGFVPTKTQEGSFGYYLQNLPLKPEGAPVYLYNKTEKRNQVHAAVVDLEIGDKDLQQCADAILRLRGEYLFHAGKEEQLAFHFTNGFLAEFSKWADGNRIKVQGNHTEWVKKAGPDTSYASFRRYMDLVFTYAGTRSLEKELKPVNDVNNIQIGDVFIQGGSPGHAVIVVNTAQNAKGEKLFLLAQSYMPAQDIHILQNSDHPDSSPWYSAEFGTELRTPEWTFRETDLKRF